MQKQVVELRALVANKDYALKFYAEQDHIYIGEHGYDDGVVARNALAFKEGKGE